MAKKISSEMYLGVWLIVMPLLGIPSSWKMALTVLSGIVLVTYEAMQKRRMLAVSESLLKNQERYQENAEQHPPVQS